MERKTAPLKRADDAVLIDSSDMTIEQVTDTIVGLARERM
jgi:cytidylate kinase